MRSGLNLRSGRAAIGHHCPCRPPVGSWAHPCLCPLEFILARRPSVRPARLTRNASAPHIFRCAGLPHPAVPGETNANGVIFTSTTGGSSSSAGGRTAAGHHRPEWG